MQVRDSFLAQYIGVLKDRMNELAHGSMDVPCKEPFEHGVFVGHYRGIQEALQLLESTIEEEDQQERSQ